MALTLAERSGLIAPSATLAMAAEAKRLKADGVDVLDFALGEPDFGTPENIQEAAIRAMRAGQTHYTPPAGIIELRQAIARLYTQQHGLATEAAQVVVSNGAKHSIHNALMAVCGPGDEVIIPAPYWVSYSDLVKLTGATPVVIPTPEASGFKLTPEQFRAAITPRTKLLMINSPSNPTGVVYSRGELEALADVVLGVDHVGVLSDEIYEQLLYGDAQADLLRDPPARSGRADDHDLGGEQDVCDDRLADRLVGRPARGGQVHGRPAKPGDEQPLLDQPVGRAGGGPGATRFGRGHVGPVHRAARRTSWSGSPACPA